MDKAKECLERIRLIQGVNYGQISNEQVEVLFSWFCLDEQQQAQVYELMHSNGIYPVPENDLYRPPKPPSPTPEELAEKAAKKEEERIDHFERELYFSLEAMSSKPSLIDQYRAEMPILRHEIAKRKPRGGYGCTGYNTPHRIIASAVTAISDARLRKKPSRGASICAAPRIAEIETFYRWLSHLFTEAEIVCLIDGCAGEPPLSSDLQEIMLVLLHNAPNTRGLVIRRTLASMLSDKSQ